MVKDNSKTYHIEKECYLWDFNIRTWNDFCQFFNNEFDLCKDTIYKPLLRNYVWRGHRLNKWKLESFFDREFNKVEGIKELSDEERINKRDYILRRHLNSFVYACRGKLTDFSLSVRELKSLVGISDEKYEKYLKENRYRFENDDFYSLAEVLGNWINKGILNRNHIWALGQHYGLATPLLDWCYSPFVAALFAFGKKNEKKDNNDYRVIFGLKVKEVDETLNLPIDGRQLECFDPMSSEHPRLINQRGLFTITKNGKDIEAVLKENKDGHVEKSKPKRNNPWLIRIKIEDTPDNRQHFLHGLNAMDINHMSLYPEIQGTAQFCNLGIELDDYARFRVQSPFRELP